MGGTNSLPFIIFSVNSIANKLLLQQSLCPLRINNAIKSIYFDKKPTDFDHIAEKSILRNCAIR